MITKTKLQKERKIMNKMENNKYTDVPKVIIYQHEIVAVGNGRSSCCALKTWKRPIRQLCSDIHVSQCEYRLMVRQHELSQFELCMSPDKVLKKYFCCVRKDKGQNVKIQAKGDIKADACDKG